MGTLFMVNVPHNCSEEELTLWVELSAIEVKQVRVIRDTGSGTSPSFAYVESTGGRIVLERNANQGTPPAGRALEAHVSRIVKIGSMERSPANHFVFPVGSDLGIPFERHTAGRSQAPVRPPVVLHLYGHDILEQ